MITTINDILDDLVNTLDAYENKSKVFSNQGQSLDGYSALANFISIAEKARELQIDVLNNMEKY